MEKYFFANWKTYQSVQGLKKFFKAYKQNYKSKQDNSTGHLVVAASYEQLFMAQRITKGTKCRIAAQDCSQFIAGPYTGQVSVQGLSDLGIQFSIIGHSEARIHLGQSNDIIALKFKLLLAAGISPILCIGETLAQKEDGMTLQILYDQLESILAILQDYQGSNSIFIAYEPVYAIGSGIIPDIQELQDVFYFLRNLTEQLLVAKNVMFLYGGSVSGSNISQLSKISGISGFLIGKASIDFQELKKIVEFK